MQGCFGSGTLSLIFTWAVYYKETKPLYFFGLSIKHSLLQFLESMEMYNEQSEDVMLKENTINWDQIHLDKLLASGNFGYVYKGIKFKSKGPSSKSCKAFFFEK